MDSIICDSSKGDGDMLEILCANIDSTVWSCTQLPHPHDRLDKGCYLGFVLLLLSVQVLAVEIHWICQLKEAVSQ